MDVATNAAYPTPYAHSPLLPMLLMSLATQKISPNTKEEFANEYDFIVVGAGTAGAIVANRLSEIPCVKVLLLEAGKAPPLINDIPIIWSYFLNTDLDWRYVTEPQEHTGKSWKNRRITYPRGKVLGGSSILNAVAYVRGNRRNYDDWARGGAVGWSYNDVFPYFLKMEDEQEKRFLENGYHVRGGPVTVTSQDYKSVFDQHIEAAAQEMGIDIVDSNGQTQTGFFDFQANIRNGQRCSTAKAYLVPAENRTNLDIIANAHVTKVLIEHRRAVGVQFDYKNASHEVRVSREVILSAGAINTPQLLMLSGIGPREQLEQHNIEVVKDLPVGKNLQDHCSTPLVFYLDSSIPSRDQILNDPKNLDEYIQNKTGPLAGSGQVNAHLNGDIPKEPGEDFPEFQLAFLQTGVKGYKNYGMEEDVYQKAYAPYENKTVYNCHVQIFPAKSKGSVRLNSPDPYDAPLIDPNYLSNDRDRYVMVEGMKVCQKFSNTAAMTKIGSKRFEIPHPGCEAHPIDSEEYYKCLTEHIIYTIYHACGTTKMGYPGDEDTVLDPQLRVKGIKGLRVVDASVMPIITSGNTNVPVMMIAEKASDIIKTTIQCKPPAI